MHTRNHTQSFKAVIRYFGTVAIASALLIVSLMALAAKAQAAGYDIHGGAAGTQTIHHCGWVPTERAIYTRASRNTVIIQNKLTDLGYYRGAVDGLNTPITRAAVAAFQRDYGLRVDGVVGIETSQAIGYVGNNASWVRSCHRAYNPANSRI